MKTEADFKDGEVVIFSNKARTATFTGKVDFSYGEEAEGFVRVEMIFTETSDHGNTVLVQVDQIYDAPK